MAFHDALFADTAQMEDVAGERVHDTMQMLKAVRADCSRRGQVLVSMSQTKPGRIGIVDGDGWTDAADAIANRLVI
ncbi:hypothetical protein [Bradyrhizobium sp. sBnM-33]|nr:hypothetical protein [Bradyrhizobium sp. sBnM-33]WOH52280.1 hypothetical protein RX328_08660 [Bradyrhizobium sp. sBnM-33]